MIPIVIAVLQGVATPGINIVGMTMLLQFVVSFGFILVVNAPQNMVAYGTDTFEARDFVRTGLVLTVDRVRAGDAARRDLLALARIRVEGYRLFFSAMSPLMSCTSSLRLKRQPAGVFTKRSLVGAAHHRDQPVLGLADDQIVRDGARRIAIDLDDDVGDVVLALRPLAFHRHDA